MSVFYLLSLITLTLLTNSYEVQAQIEEIGTEITFPPDIEIDSESSTLLPDIAMSPQSESSSILPDIVTTYSESSTFDYSSITEITISESEIGDISTNPLPSDKDVMSSVSSSSDITEFSELPQPAIGNNITASPDSSKNKKSWLNTAIIIAIIALLVIAVIIGILVWVICRLMKKSMNTSVDDSEIKPEDIEAQQAIEPKGMEPIGEESIKQEDHTIRSANVEPVDTVEPQQSPKDETTIETTIQDSKETQKDETKQLASQQKPQTSSPEEEDTNVMYVIDGRKRTIK